MMPGSSLSPSSYQVFVLSTADLGGDTDTQEPEGPFYGSASIRILPLATVSGQSLSSLVSTYSVVLDTD